MYNVDDKGNSMFIRVGILVSLIIALMHFDLIGLETIGLVHVAIPTSHFLMNLPYRQNLHVFGKLALLFQFLY